MPLLLQCRTVAKGLDVENSNLDLATRMQNFETRAELTEYLSDKSYRKVADFYKTLYVRTTEEIEKKWEEINHTVFTKEAADHLLAPLKRVEKKYPLMRFVKADNSLQRMLAFVIEKTGGELDSQRILFRQIMDHENLKRLFSGYRLESDYFLMPMAAAVRVLAPHGSQTLRDYLFMLLNEEDPYILVGLGFSPNEASEEILAAREEALSEKSFERTRQVLAHFESYQIPNLSNNRYDPSYKAYKPKQYSVLAEILNGLNEEHTVEAFEQIFRVFNTCYDKKDRLAGFIAFFRGLAVQQPVIETVEDKRNWFQRLFRINELQKPYNVYPSTILATFFRAVNDKDAIARLVSTWFTLCVGEIINGFFPEPSVLQSDFTSGKNPFAVGVIQEKLKLLSYEDKENVIQNILDKLETLKAKFLKGSQNYEDIEALEAKVKELKKNVETWSDWCAQPYVILRDFTQRLFLRRENTNNNQVQYDSLLAGFESNVGNKNRALLQFLEKANEIIDINRKIEEVAAEIKVVADQIERAESCQEQDELRRMRGELEKRLRRYSEFIYALNTVKINSHSEVE